MAAGRLPDNTSIIIPRVVCREPAAEIDFYVQARLEAGKDELPRLYQRPAGTGCARRLKRRTG
jgi:hypothetical protein